MLETESSLELSVLESVPEAFGDAPPIVDQAIACDVVADVLDIACEQGEGVGVEARIDPPGGSR
jgi:hypothetical protein